MKRLAAVALFLLLGLMINVGVAWTLAMKPPSTFQQVARSQRWTQLGQSHWVYHDLVSARGFGEQLLRESEKGVPQELPTAPFISEPEWMSQIPSASGFHGDPWKDIDYSIDGPLREIDQPARLYIEYYAGWPWPTMMYRKWERWFRSSKGPFLRNESIGLSSPPGFLASYAARLELPSTPVWPGILLNSILYAAGLWVCTFGLARLLNLIRSRIRTRRGLCPACAYNLRGAAHERCPECGHAPHPRRRINDEVRTTRHPNA